MVKSQHLFCLLLLNVGFLGLSISNVNAQKVKEGVIEYEISYPKMTDEMKKNDAMLPKSMSIYFKEDKSKLVLHTIMGNTVILSDKKLQVTYVLMEMMGKKIAMKTSDSLLKSTAPTIELLKGSKSIAGYKCKKARITTTTDGKSNSIDCYYTEDLPDVTASMYANVGANFKGIMLEYEMLSNEIRMHMEAVSVQPKTIDNHEFEVPSDYEIVDQQRMMQEMGAPTGE